MQHKINILASSNIEWVASNGRTITLGYELVQATTDLLDNGNYSQDAHGLNLNLISLIDDQYQPNLNIIQPTPVKGFAGRVGVIGLTAERVAQLATCKAEVESNLTWIAYQTAVTKGNAIISEAAREERRIASIL